MKTVIPVIRDVKYSHHALEIFNSQIKSFGLFETGGVLMGYLENEVLIISKASDPGPRAIHEPDYFQADANYVDMYIDMEYANSAGKNRYIGEWHTHPQIEPYPTEKDFTSLSEITDSSDDFVLMLIIGAVRYSPEMFLKQHISVLKYKNDSSFYKF